MAPKERSLGLAEGELALAAHSADWADAFASEAARIRAAMRAITLTLDHIGSTSVPGLPAKPILDLAVCVSPRAEPAAASALEELGYTDRGYRSGRLFVRCDSQGARTHNLHLYLDGDSEHRDQICFRNALRADPALRDAYAALKRELVGKLGAAGRVHYADAKAAFIQAAIRAERSAPD